VNEVHPKDRDIAMVFQDYALYPHMSVYDNMAFGLKLRKYPKSEIRERVHEAAEILGITDLLDRKPKELSGGQRQRVAVGRAIVRKPEVFLFDEPLSNLDAKLRVQMRAEIIKLRSKLETTMIYVTHDQVEAMTMGDRIVVMKDGLIQQIDTPLNLYNRPRNIFVAGFIGSPTMNFVEGGVLSGPNGRLFFSEGSFKFEIPESYAPYLRDYIGRELVFGIRPEDILDAGPDVEVGSNPKITAKVEVVEPMGNEIFVYLSTGRSQLVSRMDTDSMPRPGQDMEVVLDLGKSHFFDRDTGDNLLR